MLQAAARYQRRSSGRLIRGTAFGTLHVMEPILLITNRAAGTADEARIAAAVELLSAETSVEVAATASPGELDGALHRAGSRRIVVAGGDGSMHVVVAALHRRRELGGTVLGLIPVGTGNDFARGAEIPLEVEGAVEVVLRGEVRAVDLIVDEAGGVVVNNVHVGAGAQASRKSKRWKERLGAIGAGRFNLGRIGYPRGALIASFNPPFVRLRVEVDGRVVNDVDRPVLMVALGNGSHVGGGTELNPRADPEDGLIDVLVSRSVGPLSRYGYVLQLRLGRHPERDDVVNLSGRTVLITGEPFYCSADGELYGPESRRTWTVERAAYRMTLPY